LKEKRAEERGYEKLCDGGEAKESKASEDKVVAFNVSRLVVSSGCFV
jgi:hypothetical protein